MPDPQQPTQPQAQDLDIVQHPTLGQLSFPKSMPPDERNEIIQQMEAEHQAAPKIPSASGTANTRSGLQKFGDALLPDAVMHPVDAATDEWKDLKEHPLKTIGTTWAKSATMVPRAIASTVGNTVAEDYEAGKSLLHGNPAEAAEHELKSIPILGNAVDSVAHMDDVGGTGSYLGDLKSTVSNPEAMGTLTGAAAQIAPLALGEVDSAAPGRTPIAPLNIGSRVKDFVRGPINEPIAGQTVSPAERYASAKRVGVNPDLADATNATIPKLFRNETQFGNFGGPVFDAQRATNLRGLDTFKEGTSARMSPFDPETGGTALRTDLKAPFTDLQNRGHDFLNEASPLPGEAGGSKVQGDLKSTLDKAHDAAQSVYKDTSENYGANSSNGTPEIRALAADLANANAGVNEAHPSLGSSKINSLLREAQNLGANGPVRLDTLIRARTKLLDLTRDPEIIKSSSLKDVQALSKAYDNAITASLPQDAAEAWRGANAKWETIKSTYDNSSNPFYHAIRTPSPSSLAEGIGDPTPENVRAMRSAITPEGMGVVQRGVANKLLGTAADGSYDLRNFGSRLEKLPEGYRNELFTNPQQGDLRGIARDYRTVSPFEPAANTANPEELTRGIGLGPKTAAGLRNVRDVPVKPEGAAGPQLQRIGETGLGALRRGTFEDLLGTTPEGTANYKAFPNKLAHLNPGYSSELFGPELERDMEDISRTGRMLTDDPNRSGTAKLEQKINEVPTAASALMKGQPVKAGMLALQRPIAKLMTNPEFVDWMMKPNVPKTAAASKSRMFFAPATLGASRRNAQAQ